MSTSIGSVQIALEAVDNISGVMDQVKGSISGLSGVATILGQNIGGIGRIVGDLGGPFKGVADIIGGFATGGPAGAGIAAIGECVGFLKGSVEAAGESDRVMAALRKTVEDQGTAWGTVKDAVDGTLKSMQSTTRFSDEELAKALQTLATHGMSVKEALKALPTVMDTAVGSGKPLSEVATAIGKAFEGQDTSLTRIVPAIGELGIKMGAGQDNAGKFQEALGLLNQRFGGQALSDAQTYAGTQERMANAWNEFQETIGKAVVPALTDVMNAFMDIGKQGIGPLMDSFGELWKELFGGDFDLKGFGKYVTENIIMILQWTAKFIHEDLVPAIKAIHETFKDVSDTVGPPLKAIVEAVKGFLDALQGAFQGFYDWLVGRSLWPEMWNELLTVASRLIGQLIGDLGSRFFDPMKKGFTDATQAVQKTWDDAWNATKTTLNTLMPQIQTDLNTALDGLKSALTTSTGTYAPTMTSALSAMQGAMNAGFALVKGDWQGALDAISGALTSWGDTAKGITDGIMGQLKGAVDTGVAGMKGAFDGLISAGQGAVGQAQSLFSQVQGAISNAWNMVTGTTTGSAVAQTLGTQPPIYTEGEPVVISQIGPTVEQNCPPGYYKSGGICVPYPATAAAASTPSPTSVTVNNTIQVDSQTVSKVVQKSIVSSINSRERR